MGLPVDVLQFSSEAENSLDLLRGARIAFVAGKAATFGMVRMFEAHTERLPFEIRAFYEPEEAEAWLAEP